MSANEDRAPAWHERVEHLQVLEPRLRRAMAWTAVAYAASLAAFMAIMVSDINGDPTPLSMVLFALCVLPFPLLLFSLFVGWLVVRGRIWELSPAGRQVDAALTGFLVGLVNRIFGWTSKVTEEGRRQMRKTP